MVNINKENFVGFNLLKRDKHLFECKTGDLVAILIHSESQKLATDDKDGVVAALVVGRVYKWCDSLLNNRIVSTGIRSSKLFYESDFDKCYVDYDISKLDRSVVKFTIGDVVKYKHRAKVKECIVEGLLVNNVYKTAPLNVEYHLSDGYSTIIISQEELMKGLQ